MQGKGEKIAQNFGRKTYT